MKPSSGGTKIEVPEARNTIVSACIVFTPIWRITTQRRMAADTDVDCVADALRRRNRWRS